MYSWVGTQGATPLLPFQGEKNQSRAREALPGNRMEQEGDNKQGPLSGDSRGCQAQ